MMYLEKSPKVFNIKSWFFAVVINGSPRALGNTDAILNKFIEGTGLEKISTKYFILRDLNIADCIGCCMCKNESKCYFQDDMSEIRKSLEMSDLLVFASPIYWSEITGLMKTFFDRLYFYHHCNTKHLISGKKAIIITTMGEVNNIKYESEVLVEFYKRTLRSLNISILNSVFFDDLMVKEAIVKKPEYLEQVYNLGKNLKLKSENTMRIIPLKISVHF